MLRVTQILALCGLREWPRHIPAAEREWYLQRGSAIHKAAALYDNDMLDPDSLDPRIAGFVAAYRRFREEVGGSLLLCEHHVECPRLGYHGTLDRVFGPSNAWKGRVLLDIKTNEADAATKLQTAAYRMALGWKVSRGAVALRDDGTYRLYLYDDDAGDEAAWLACVRLAGWVGKNAPLHLQGGATAEPCKGESGCSTGNQEDA